jgi:hypothetical protein
LKNSIRVDSVDVARYYVMSELGKKNEIWNKSEEWVKEFNAGLNDSSPGKIMESAKNLSAERANELHSRLSDRALLWREIELHSFELYLPQINPRVNQYLQAISWNLDSFSKLVNGNDDLLEFHDVGRKIWHDRLIALDQLNRIRIIDGSHRAVIMRNRGKEHFQVYVGISDSQTYGKKEIIYSSNYIK